jgi:hypothetical protein
MSDSVISETDYGVKRYLAYSYQSECGDHTWHRKHWVSVHWRRHAGQTPPVSKVFQLYPQEQPQRSDCAGVQPQRGQRMRGPETPVFSSLPGSAEGVFTGIDMRQMRRR